MQNQTFLIIIDIFAELTYAAIYLGAAFVTFMIFRQEKVKNWLSKHSKILMIVSFIITTQLLYSAGSLFVNYFLFFPRRIILGDSLIASIRCFAGLLMLAGLVAGSILIVKSKGKEDQLEELNTENK